MSSLPPGALAFLRQLGQGQTDQLEGQPTSGADPFTGTYASLEDRFQSKGRVLEVHARRLYISEELLEETQSTPMGIVVQSNKTKHRRKNSICCLIAFLQENLVLPFYSDDGQELWERHEANRDRDQKDTRDEYVVSLKQSGWLKGARGEILFSYGEKITSKFGTQWSKYKCVGGAHLLEALYQAWAEEPDNEQLLITVNFGVPN
eukprot:4963154-Pyramimonas_sp.AAC.1